MTAQQHPAARSRRHTATHAIVVVVALALAAGLVVWSSGRDLSGHDELRVAEANTAIAFGPLDGVGIVELMRAVDTLIEVCRAKPDARVDGLTMRQVVADAASALDESHPELARRLDRGCP